MTRVARTSDLTVATRPGLALVARGEPAVRRAANDDQYSEGPNVPLAPPPEVGPVVFRVAPGGQSQLVQVSIDPPPMDKHVDQSGESRFDSASPDVPLFVEGPAPADPHQGAIGDCYLIASLSSLALQDPDVLERMIADNGDGTFTVTFQELNRETLEFHGRPVTVDGDFYVRDDGTPLYGTSGEERWIAIIEKAYAKWRGGYEEIGHGGNPVTALSSVLGVLGRQIHVPDVGTESFWDELVETLDSGRPMVAATQSNNDALYTGTRVVPGHAYSVLGYGHRDGERYVVLRNPWGHQEPGDDGADDGLFELPLSEFVRLFNNAYTVEAPRPPALQQTGAGSGRQQRHATELSVG